MPPRNREINNYYWPIMGFLLMLVIQIVIPSQFNGFESPLHGGISVLWDNLYSYEMLHLRESNVSFYHRVVFRGLHKSIVNIGLPSQFVFTLLSCFFIITNYRIIIQVSKEIHQSQNMHKWVSLFYFGCFSLLFAYLGGMFTYEEPVQYFLLLCALLMILREKILFASIFFLLALFSKETSLLFLPVLIYFSIRFKKNKLLIFLLIISVLTYGLVHYYLTPSMMKAELMDFTKTTRFFGWKSNFGSWQKTTETVFNIILILGIPIVLCLNLLKTLITGVEKGFIHSILFLCLINTILVSVAALSREARLFMLPLILFWPLSPLVMEKVPKMKVSKSFMLLLILPAILTCWYLYQPSVAGTGYLYRLYAVIYFILFGSLIFLIMKVKKKEFS